MWNNSSLRSKLESGSVIASVRGQVLLLLLHIRQLAVGIHQLIVHLHLFTLGIPCLPLLGRQPKTIPFLRPLRCQPDVRRVTGGVPWSVHCNKHCLEEVLNEPIRACFWHVTMTRRTYEAKDILIGFIGLTICV